MLKAEQIPDEVVKAFEEEYHFGEGDWKRNAIAAAINAWPGMGPIRTDQPIGDWCDKLPAIILPLTENTDEVA